MTYMFARTCRSYFIRTRCVSLAGDLPERLHARGTLPTLWAFINTRSSTAAKQTILIKLVEN